MTDQFRKSLERASERVSKWPDTRRGAFEQRSGLKLPPKKTPKECLCKLCIYSDVIHGLVKRQKSKKDKELVEYLYDRLIHAEEDADYWRIQRHGGFEGLTDVDREKIGKFYSRKSE